MRGRQILFVTLAVLGLGPLVGAVKDGDWGSAVLRAAPVVTGTVLALTELRNSPPPGAWTKRRLVLALALGVPAAVILLSLLVLFALTEDDLVVRLVCGLSGLVAVGLLVHTVRVWRREHRAAAVARG